MNIVVTIPKNRQAEIEEEERQLQARLDAGEEGLSYFWSLSRRPKDLREGDRVYFIWDGAMRAFHHVTGFDEDMRCETTGRQYRGCCVMLDPRIHEIVPIPMKGFQGYRYYTAPVCEKGALAEVERAFGDALKEFVGRSNTETTRQAIAAQLHEIANRYTDDVNMSEWFSIDVDGDKHKVNITPRNIYAALLLQGQANPPFRTVVARHYEDGDNVWEMVGDQVVCRPKLPEEYERTARVIGSEAERMEKVRNLMDQAQANCRAASAELEESDKDWANEMISKLEEKADEIEVLMRDID